MALGSSSASVIRRSSSFGGLPLADVRRRMFVSHASTAIATWPTSLAGAGLSTRFFRVRRCTALPLWIHLYILRQASSPWRIGRFLNTSAAFLVSAAFRYCQMCPPSTEGSGASASVMTLPSWFNIATSSIAIFLEPCSSAQWRRGSTSGAWPTR